MIQDPIKYHIEQGDTILTPNLRLSRTLQEMHAVAINSTSPVWRPPEIHALHNWVLEICGKLQQLSLLENKVILKKEHELILWQKVILDSQKNEDKLPILDLYNTAELVMQANQMLIDWQLKLTKEMGVQQKEYQSFRQWVNDFEKQCRHKHWQPETTQLSALNKVIRYADDAARLSITTMLPKTIVFYGFEEMTPLLKDFIKSIAKIIAVKIIDDDKQAGKCCRVTVSTTYEELLTMANWAKQTHQANPQASIGCVVSNLQEIRTDVENCFSRIFHPEAILPGIGTTERIFSITGGKALIEYPLVQTALILLSAAQESTIEMWRYLLRSPYISGAFVEMSQRYIAENQLRALPLSTLSIGELRAIIENSCPIFTKQLEQISQLGANLSQPLYCEQWCGVFTQLLEAVAWPGDRRLDSAEYQLTQHLYEIMDAFAGLDAIEAEMRYQRAVNLLRELASKHLFQAKEKTRQIQVLGLLEAAGQQFDYLWVMGMDSTAWPAPVNPNPFLPYSLQKKYAMPHSSPERELAYAKRLMHRLLHSAPEIMVSYASEEGDQTRYPSALIKDFKELDIEKLQTSTQSFRDQVNAADLERFKDDIGVPFGTNDSIKSGTRLFKLQAACPFKAYAELRLNAYDLNQASLGIEPLFKGELLHAVLEVFWKDVKSQQRLLRLEQSELNATINRATATVISHYQKHHGYLKSLLNFEEVYLQLVVDEWLHHEKQRGDFVVYALESSHQLKIGDWEFQVRVDRIDETDDGYCLIDYKSGKVSLSSWFGSRPDEPQMPLYYCYIPMEFNALAFAQLQPGNMGFKALSTDERISRSILNAAIEDSSDYPETLNDYVGHWEKCITEIMHEYANGYAKVNPKYGLYTCTQCQYQGLCRYQLSYQE